MEIYDAGEIRKVGKGLSVPSKRRAGPRGVARKATGRHRNYPAPGRGRKQAMRSRGSEREEKSRLLSHAGRWGRVQNRPRGQETGSGPASPAALPSGGAVSPSRPSRCCARRWGGFQTILFPSCSFESDIIRLSPSRNVIIKLSPNHPPPTHPHDHSPNQDDTCITDVSCTCSAHHASYTFSSPSCKFSTQHAFSLLRSPRH